MKEMGSKLQVLISTNPKEQRYMLHKYEGTLVIEGEEEKKSKHE